MGKYIKPKNRGSELRENLKSTIKRKPISKNHFSQVTGQAEIIPTWRKVFNISLWIGLAGFIVWLFTHLKIEWI